MKSELIFFYFYSQAYKNWQMSLRIELKGANFTFYLVDSNELDNICKQFNEKKY
jgi:hypothetical protein